MFFPLYNQKKNRNFVVENMKIVVYSFIINPSLFASYNSLTSSGVS